MVNVLNMDVVAGLATLEAESVNCVVTSPPYWGLRDYGTGTWEGGDAACDHQVPTLPSRNFLNGRGTGGGCKSWTTRDCSTFLNICGKCGARRVDRQIGLESTVEEYVEKMVAVFREVRRVLRADGTCWVNMGDCYGAGTNNPTSFRRDRAQVCHRRGKDCDPKRGMAAAESPLHHAVGLKPKDLVGLPWRVAFALQADGWWLRSDIVWHKPNPMPESVTDRPTRAHEYLFLLTKSARYWYDADAIKEPASADTHARYARGRSDNHKWADGGPGNQTIAKTLEHMARKNGEERTERTTGTARTNGEGVNPKCYKGSSFTKGKTGAVHANVGQGPRRSYVKQNPSFSAAVKDVVEMRNARTVWEIATQNYSGAHFATFPEALVRPCVLAGCPEGGLVLDPFAGSGTTGKVAEDLGRNAVLIELNPEYCEMIWRRCAQGALL